MAKCVVCGKDTILKHGNRPVCSRECKFKLITTILQTLRGKYESFYDKWPLNETATKEER